MQVVALARNDAQCALVTVIATCCENFAGANGQVFDDAKVCVEAVDTLRPHRDGSHQSSLINDAELACSGHVCAAATFWSASANLEGLRL